MKANNGLCIAHRDFQRSYIWDILCGLSLLMLFCMFFMHSFVVHAEGFTDVFYTNSFRGSFEWFKKMDWLGMVVQAVISIFSLVGVSLIVIRIMTSMLYLSAKGLWEEVHDLKQSGGESEMYDLGLLNMAKTWAKGKSGTGLDAILGAVLVLLPDVKRYSDFGEKSGQNFDADTSISQYMLKIALPTVLAVFFLAMGFNGTLVKGLAVTVDAMGTIADHAVSVNYSGFIDDLVNSGTGYKFMSGNDGTEAGKLAVNVQKEVYGKVVSKIRGADSAQLYAIGQKIETGPLSKDEILNAAKNSPRLDESVKAGLDGDDGDRYWELVEYNVTLGGSRAEGEGILSMPISDLLGDVAGLGGGGEEGTMANQYINIYFDQGKVSPNNYFNTNEVGR